MDQSCTSSVQPFAERVPDQHQTLQVQLPNIRVVHTAPHVMVTKRRYYASHYDETPEFPVTSVEEVELMGEMITVDKAFKKAVVRLLTTNAITTVMPLKSKFLGDGHPFSIRGFTIMRTFKY